MKKLFFISLYLPLLLSAQSMIEEKAKKLEEYYSKSYSNTDSLKYRQLFFEEFPNSFIELKSIYDYEFDKPNILVEKAYEHIFLLFNNLDNIEDSIYYNKLINVAIDGKWDADAIFCFQYGLQNRVFQNPELTFDLLYSRNDKEIKSFFYFFFDSIHPKWNDIPKELRPMKKKSVRIYKLMEQALNEVKKNNSKHCE